MVSTPTQTPGALNKLGCNSHDNNTATTSMTMVNAAGQLETHTQNKQQQKYILDMAAKNRSVN